MAPSRARWLRIQRDDLVLGFVQRFERGNREISRAHHGQSQLGHFRGRPLVLPEMSLNPHALTDNDSISRLELFQLMPNLIVGGVFTALLLTSKQRLEIGQRGFHFPLAGFRHAVREHHAIKVV